MTIDPAKLSNLSNTFSTGGGGVNFERHIQAYFLFKMLSHDVCPILEQPIEQMDFQAKHLGWDTDDLVITASSGIKPCKLLCQIKHDITISLKNAVFQDVITAAWSDFQKPDFDADSDHIALIAASTGKKSKSAMEQLHDYARYSKNVDDFLFHIQTVHHSANSVRETFSAIASITQSENDTDIWRFLKAFRLYLMDLDTGSNNILYTTLLSAIRGHSDCEPTQVWAALSEQCGIWNEKGASITRKDVPQNIQKLFDTKSSETEKYLCTFPSFDLSEEAAPFSYDYSNLVEIWGRDIQLEQLRIFTEEPQRFSFCVITGPAGIGKSKLVFYFARQYQEKADWLVRKVPLDDIAELGRVQNWDTNRNILLVVDYANEQEFVGRILRVLSRLPENISCSKIRLILIAREGTRRSPYRANDIILPKWYEHIIKGDRKIHQHLFLKDFINLQGLSQSDCTSLYYAFVSNHLKMELSEIDRKSVLELIDSSVRDEDGFVRPLYALFVMDLYHRNPNTNHLTLQQLHSQVYQRDKERWRSELNNDNLFIALLNLLLYATIFDHWESSQILPPPLDQDCYTVNTTARTLGADQKSAWFKMLTGHIEWRQGKQVLTRLTPDMVGEYYALNELDNLDDWTQQQWLHLIISRLADCREFFIRAIQDFGNNEDQVKIFLKLFHQMIPLLEECDEKTHRIFASILEVFYTNFRGEKTWKVKDLLNCYIKHNRSQYVAAAELELIIHENDPSVKPVDLESIIRNLYTQWPDSEKIASRYITLEGNRLAHQIRSQNPCLHQDMADIFALLRKWAPCPAYEMKYALIPALVKIIKASNFVLDWDTALYVEKELLRVVMDQCSEEFLLVFICCYDSILIELASKRTKALSTLSPDDQIQLKAIYDHRLEAELSFYREMIDRNPNPSFNFVWTHVSTLQKITKALFIYEGLSPETEPDSIVPYLKNTFLYMLNEFKCVYTQYHRDQNASALARHASRTLDMFCDSKSSAIPYRIKAMCILRQVK